MFTLMAGIGFRLQKLLAEDNYSSTLLAYAHSALITVGPFLCTVLVVLVIHWVRIENLAPSQLEYFQVLITYAYAFSLVTVGPSYLVVTRVVADEYYRGHIGSLFSVYLAAVALNGLIWGPWVFWYFSRLTVDWTIRLQALLLYLFATAIWMALVFISAARDYARISRIFALGSLVSLAAAYLWGKSAGLEGYLGGLVSGQALILLLLSRAIIKEFGYLEPYDYFWLRGFGKYSRLVAVGFLYNLGIWIDKFLFWASSEGITLDVGLRFCPIYDVPLFLAYLTILPSLVYFFLRMETAFFIHYHAYYQAIQRQADFNRLEVLRRAIVRSLSENLKRLLLLQGTLSGAAMLAVPWITRMAGLDPLQMSILRVAILASFLQAGVVILINLLLYFDLQKDALATAAIFCLSNAVLTAVSFHFGFLAFGYGYLSACLIALMAGIYFLNERLRMLHYWTFMHQPLPDLVLIEEED